MIMPTLYYLGAFLAIVEFSCANDDIAASWYPVPKPIQHSYSCCVYNGHSEQQLVCDPIDKECITEHREMMNLYYMMTVVVVVVPLVSIAVWCIRERVLYLRKKREKQLKKE